MTINLKDRITELLGTDDFKEIDTTDLLTAIAEVREVKGETIAAVAQARGYQPRLDPKVKKQLDTLMSNNNQLKTKLESLTKLVSDDNNDTAAVEQPMPDNTFPEWAKSLISTVTDLKTRLESADAASMRNRIVEEVAKETGKTIDPAIAATITGETDEAFRENLKKLAAILPNAGDSTAKKPGGAFGGTSPAIGNPQPDAALGDDVSKVVDAAFTAMQGKTEVPGVQENIATTKSNTPAKA